MVGNGHTKGLREVVTEVGSLPVVCDGPDVDASVDFQHRFSEWEGLGRPRSRDTLRNSDSEHRVPGLHCLTLSPARRTHDNEHISYSIPFHERVGQGLRRLIETPAI